MAENEIPVLVSLLTVTRYPNMVYPVQIMARGKVLPMDRGRAVLKYVETQTDEETGQLSDSFVTVQIGANDVTILRESEVTNTMVFSRGQRYEGVYNTPYGELSMGIFTRDIRTAVAPDRGSVHLKYMLDFNGGRVSTNEIHLEYFSEQASREKSAPGKRPGKPRKTGGHSGPRAEKAQEAGGSPPETC